MNPKPDGRRTNGGARRGAGRKPQTGARIVKNELRLSIGHYTPAQRETLIRLVNEWLAQESRNEMEIIVERIVSGGASRTQQELYENENLKELMRGHGGRRGFTIRYRADRDMTGNFGNTGEIQIVAKDAATARRYQQAKKARTARA